MDREEVEQARGVIRAVGTALKRATDAGPAPASLESLLDAARRAVPRRLDPHPCTVRCWRVGGACDLQADGKCMECGSPGIRVDDEDFKRLCGPKDVVDLCESLLGLREVLGHPAVLAAAYTAERIP